MGLESGEFVSPNVCSVLYIIHCRVVSVSIYFFILFVFVPIYVLVQYECMLAATYCTYSDCGLLLFLFILMDLGIDIRLKFISLRFFSVFGVLCYVTAGCYCV